MPNGLHTPSFGLQRHINCMFLISPRFNKISPDTPPPPHKSFDGSPPPLSSLNCLPPDPLLMFNRLHYVIYGLQRHRNCVFLISPRFTSPNVLKSYIQCHPLFKVVKLKALPILIFFLIKC